MHQKVWVIDGIHVYIGSSNMDWLSLSQVKEMGVTVHNSTSIGSNVQQYFNSWWAFADPQLLETSSKGSYESTQFQTLLEGPCWSKHVANCENPIADEFPFPNNINHQLDVSFNGNIPSSNFITGSPREVLGNSDHRSRSSLRTWDLDGLVYTIRSATEFVYLSVMDYIPSSLYGTDTASGQMAWWSNLNDALLAVQYGKNVTVKLLISNWAHSDPFIFQQLQGLQQQGSACSTKSAHPCGRLEIRIYEVPGWNQTTDFEGAVDPMYPPFSRVAHGKYIVSDTRANIGTSNMAFSYFYSTAGASFNTDDSNLVANLQTSFLRDWESIYSFGLNDWLDANENLNRETTEHEIYNNADLYH